MSQQNENLVSHSEAWDDTLLVEQYNATMEKIKQQVTHKMAGLSDNNTDDSKGPTEPSQPSDVSQQLHKKKKKKKNKKKQEEWRAGDSCRCVYEEDGQAYEATITAVTSSKATLTYVGYGNTDAVALHKLYRSKGSLTRMLQEKEAEAVMAEWQGESGVEDTGSTAESEAAAGPWMPAPSRHSSSGRPTSRQRYSLGAPIPGLPPPPALAGGSEELHTMLMSWYMTGYHTGYYKGVTDHQNRRT